MGTLQFERPLQGGLDLFRRAAGLDGIAGRQQCEFVTRHPADHRPGAHHRSQTPRDLDQQFVTFAQAVEVVDVTEVVQAQVEHGQWDARVVALQRRFLQRQLELGPCDQARQGSRPRNWSSWSTAADKRLRIRL